jgi:hypothetical protein
MSGVPWALISRATMHLSWFSLRLGAFAWPSLIQGMARQGAKAQRKSGPTGLIAKPESSWQAIRFTTSSAKSRHQLFDGLLQEFGSAELHAESPDFACFDLVLGRRFLAQNLCVTAAQPFRDRCHFEFGHIAVVAVVGLAGSSLGV